MKKIILVLFSCILFLGSIATPNIYAVDEFILVEYDNQGNIVKEVEKFSDFDTANQKRRSLGRSKNHGVLHQGELLAVNYGVIDFNSSISNGSTFKIVNAENNVNGYFSSIYSADAMYLGTFNGTKDVMFRLGGANFLTNRIQGDLKAKILPFSTDYAYSRYTIERGNLRHYLSSDIYKKSSYGLDIGPAPQFLKENTTYYSYDGHYFYTDYKVMINDAVNGNYTQAVNASQPYYNYYTYLPYRTKTNYTVDQFKDWFNNKMEYHKPTLRYGSTLISKLNGTEQAFIDSQNVYGANALLTYGISRNESGDGYSSIAQNKLNLFGHSAFDSSPYTSATGYSTNGASVYDHANVWMSKGYLNPRDWRYFGGHLGDKAAGVNIQYASDPYWGEKAGAVYYQFDKAYGLKDYRSYTIGITNDKQVDVYANVDDDRPIFNLKAIAERPLVILSKTVLNGKTWYKVQSDGIINEQRTTLKILEDGKYDFAEQYGFVKAEVFKHIFEGKKTVENTVTPKPVFPQEDLPGDTGKLIEKMRQLLSSGNDDKYFSDVALNTSVKVVDQLAVNQVVATVFDKRGNRKTSGNFATGDYIELKAKNQLMKKLSVVVLGDANGDGRVSVADITAVIRHIEGIRKLSNEYFKAVNFRNQQQLSVSSITTIIRHIEGLKEIK